MRARESASKSRKEPYIFWKEPHIFWKEPYIVNTEADYLTAPFNPHARERAEGHLIKIDTRAICLRKWALHLRKRALHLRKWALHLHAWKLSPTSSEMRRITLQLFSICARESAPRGILSRWVQEPYVFANEPYIFGNEPYIFGNEVDYVAALFNARTWQHAQGHLVVKEPFISNRESALFISRKRRCRAHFRRCRAHLRRHMALIGKVLFLSSRKRAQGRKRAPDLLSRAQYLGKRALYVHSRGGLPCSPFQSAHTRARRGASYRDR